MKVVFSPRCLEYGLSGHPESSQRVRLIKETLTSEAGFSFVEEFPLIDEALILKTHAPRLLEALKSGKFSDPDTPALEGIYEFARLSASAAVYAGEVALREGLCFSLVRPPGHHAGFHSLGGFCYLNNIAMAVENILPKVSSVAILDIDVHHGNGTQELVMGKPGIRYASLHQSPLYPGTGLSSLGNCYNFPLPPGTGIKEYLSHLRQALEIIKTFRPNLLAISLGLDTYKGDSLAQLEIDIDDYEKIAREIAGLRLSSLVVLEGGYSKDIGRCTYRFLRGLEG